MKGAFDSVTLRADGTVEARGEFRSDPDTSGRDAIVSFYVVQGGTRIEGDGRWPAGTPDWTGTGGAGLSPGPAVASALAVSTRVDPDGFQTFTWTEEVEVTGAAA